MGSEGVRPCLLVPHYNHDAQLVPALDRLLRFGLPLIVVDDGSSASSFAALETAVRDWPSILLDRQPANRGKGSAVMRGLRLAASHGYTHALQIDADGQHRAEDIPALIAEARAHPGALVSGAPVYDATVPGARLHGRKISLFWTRLETWSRDILDPMCGFRVYPVDALVALVREREPGPGMEFDAEILVRAHWGGIPLRFVPTAVTYPPGGLSHFRMVRDNVRISVMHTRLFFGMVRRAPRLLAARLRAKSVA
jgi:glycosyltransferase involved in cell wall biosynthesis